MKTDRMLYKEFDDLLLATKAVVDWWMKNQCCTLFDPLYSLEYAWKRTQMDDDCTIAFGKELGTYIIDWFNNKPKQKELYFSTNTVPSLMNSDMERATRILFEKGLIREYDLPLASWTCIERTGHGTLLVCGNIGPLPDELRKPLAAADSTVRIDLSKEGAEFIDVTASKNNSTKKPRTFPQLQDALIDFEDDFEDDDFEDQPDSDLE